MNTIREQLLSDEHWGPDPAPFPHVGYAGEQRSSQYYPDQAITMHNSMRAYPDPQVQELQVAEQLSSEGALCLSVLQDQRWQGSEDQLEQVMARHPLGEAGFTEDEDLFEEQARAATESLDYSGIAPAFLAQEDGLMVSRRRLTLLSSYVAPYFIGVESYVFNPSTLEEVGVEPDSIIKRGKNVVLPPLIVGETYSMRARRRGPTHLSKIVSAQAILPPEGVTAGVHIPRQPGD